MRPREHAVLAGGREIDLTSREYDIVLKLAEHPGWVFTAEQLADTDESGEFSPESVSVHVSHLRQKLAVAGVEGAVETVRGVGYRLHPDGGDALQPEPDGTMPEAAAQDGAGGSALSDSLWHLEEAVVQIEHTGTPEQRAAAAAALDAARRAVYSLLAG